MSTRLGIDLIDYQHESLLKLVDNLCELRYQTISTIAVLAIWDELGRELQAHFADEERLFMRVSFARHKQHAHAQDHAAILETYTRLNPTLVVDAQFSASEWGTTIRSTLLKHYTSFDLDMHRYLEGSASMELLGE